MYFLSFPIEHKGSSVLEQGGKLPPMNAMDGQPWQRFEQEMDEFILMVEGYQTHASKLTSEEAKPILATTKATNKRFTRFVSGLLEMNWDNASIPKKLKYALKALNRLEAMLHKATYMGSPVQPTPAHIQEGLSAYSREATGKSLSKE